MGYLRGLVAAPSVVPLEPAPEVSAALEAVRDLPQSVLLESAGPVTRESRFSYLMADPEAVLRSAPSPTLLDDARRLMAGARPTPVADLPPFQGGLAGYLAYEAGAALESIDPRPDLPAGTVLGRYPWVIAWDRERRRAWLVDHRDDPAATAALLERLSRASAPAAGDPPPEAPVPASSLPHDRYLAAVERIREYIRAGDVFQVNLTQCFSLPLRTDAATIYRRLRHLSPAAYAAFLDLGDHQVVSASPELFLALAGRRVETRPIKGTRPRGIDAEDDARLGRELVASAKDQAENVMIVDLLRNDLSRVAEPGSVSVPSLAILERYPTVQHLVSTVQARLSSGQDAFDLLRATLPGGSITGAPKVRAMEIIRELEPVARGAYCGAIGYLTWQGDMTMSVAIRTLVCRAGRAAVHAGGGVVVDSEPGAEYEESLVKARAMLRAAQ